MPRTTTLDTGDKVEYGMSVFVRHAGQDVWLTMKVKGTVRDGESASRASKRITGFVEDRIARKVDEFINQ